VKEEIKMPFEIITIIGIRDISNGLSTQN